MDSNVTIKGQDKLLRHLKKIANPVATFDKAILETAVRSHRELVIATQTKKGRSDTFTIKAPREEFGDMIVKQNNLATGDTSRGWSQPFRISEGYKISNGKKTSDGRYLVAELLEKGTKEIFPRSKKVLYIPLTRKGQRKAYGAKPEGVFGKDYIFLKKVKARKGRDYMQGIVKRSSTFLTKEIIKDIRKVYA